MANGQYVTRHVGTALIQCGEFKTVDEVVFAQPDPCRRATFPIPPISAA